MKAGKQLTRTVKGDIIKVITYFRSLWEAISLLPRLKQIMDKYDTDPHKLYKAMKRADPYLTEEGRSLPKRSIVMKLAFTDQQKEERQKWAGRTLLSWGGTKAERQRVVTQRNAMRAGGPTASRPISP